MLQVKTPLIYSPLRFSKTENGDFTAIFNANADNQPTGPQGPYQSPIQVQVACLGKFAVSPWRVHPSDDAHAEEAELGHAQGGQGAPHERV